MYDWGDRTLRDFPFFTTQYGVASIVLKEVPYRGEAYIKIQSALDPAALLDECVGFCRAVGAARVYAAGHAFLAEYPIHTSVLQMRCSREALDDTDAALFPVQEATLQNWRELYNIKMADVDNASYMTENDGRRMLEAGNGYFIHRNGKLIGIGVAAGDKIDAVISCAPGNGRDVVLALNHALSGDSVQLEVASTNKRAIKLYEKLGFLTVNEVSRWHKIY